MDQELLKKVLADSDFTKSLLNMENPEDVQAALKEKGVDITLEEINTIRKALEQQENGELSDDDLEDVAGGSLTIAAALGIAAIIGASVGGAIKLGEKVTEWTRRRW